jgi:hypothetical protein
VWFGVLLVLLGLPQLFRRLGRSTGLATLISLPLIFMGLGLLTQCAVRWNSVRCRQSIEWRRLRLVRLFGLLSTYNGTLSMIRAVLMMPGMLLFVIGVWRSREFARWRCWLVMAFLLGMGAAIFGMLMAGVLFAALFYSAFGGYGALMLRKGQIDCFVHPTWIYKLYLT